MAQHRQAKKRNRQTIKKTARNQRIRTTMRTYIKRIRAAITNGDSEEANKNLKIAISNIDTAAQKGVIHRRTASRYVSRLSLAVNKFSKEKA